MPPATSSSAKGTTRARSDTEAPPDVEGEFIEALNSFGRALEKAWSSDVRKVVTSGARRFGSAIRPGWSPEERQQRLSEALSEQERDLQEHWAPEVLETRTESAFRAYLAAVKDTWNRLDVDAVEPDDLYRIAQSLYWAASCAATAQGAVMQRWVSGGFEAASPMTAWQSGEI